MNSRRFLALTLLLSGLLAFSLTAAPKSDLKARKGEWRATGTDECPRNTVCAEWFAQSDDSTVRTGLTCCIAPKKLGSGDFWACAAFRDDDID